MRVWSADLLCLASSTPVALGSFRQNKTHLGCLYLHSTSRRGTGDWGSAGSLQFTQNNSGSPGVCYCRDNKAKALPEQTNVLAEEQQGFASPGRECQEHGHGLRMGASLQMRRFLLENQPWFLFYTKTSQCHTKVVSAGLPEQVCREGTASRLCCH